MYSSFYYPYNVAPAPTVAPPTRLPAVSPDVASRTVQRLILLQLEDHFDVVQPDALKRLEQELVVFVSSIFERAHEYANLAQRASPVAQDLLVSCNEHNLKINDLHHVAVQASSQKARAPTLIPPPSRSPSPDLLSSDDEGAAPIIPATLRGLPPYLPPLPPKHTYLRTPASPPKKAALPSLEKKLKNAGLVQESLKNLLTATEDNYGQEDGELLGHIVNWEASTYPRKRWRIGRD